MRKAVIVSTAIAFGLISCSREPYGVVSHRGRNGHPDQWILRINKDTYRVSIDTNGDGRPDVIKSYQENEIVKIEDDRNSDGKVDLVQEYAHGVLLREVHDDNFDGRPEAIKTFRPNGTLAIIERDPRERGYVDVVEYYDASGKLTRREVRPK